MFPTNNTGCLPTLTYCVATILADYKILNSFRFASICKSFFCLLCVNTGTNKAVVYQNQESGCLFVLSQIRSEHVIAHSTYLLKKIPDDESYTLAMDVVQTLSLELIEGVSNCDNSNFGVEGSCSPLADYLLKGKGCKILNLLLDLIKKGLSCPPEIAHLCTSLLLILTSFKPTDFISARQALLTEELYTGGHRCDLVDKLLLQNLKQCGIYKYKVNWVKLHNNLSERKSKKQRKGAKLRPRALSNRIGELTRQHLLARETSSQSSDESGSRVPPSKSTNESHLLKKLGKSRPAPAKSRAGDQPFLKSRTRFKMSVESTKNKSANCVAADVNGFDVNDGRKKADEKLKEYDNIDGFEGPFHLATVLLDLLESSFCSRYSCSSHCNEPSSPTDGDSPMSMAIQLVSAITALQQTKVAFTRSNSVDNNKLMSQISFEDTRWTSESLSHLQRLVLRTVIVLCHVGLEHGEDVNELVHCQAVDSLLRVSTDILSKGGMIPHGSNPRSGLRNRFKKVDSLDNMKDLSAGDAANELQTTASKNGSIPTVILDDSDCDELGNEKMTFQEKFKDKYCKLKRQVFMDYDSDIPSCLLFVADVVTGLFVVLSRALQTSPATTNPKQLSEVCSLMHEFNNCHGFIVFSSLLQQVSALCDDVNQNYESTKNNGSGPLLSPLKSPSYIRLKSQFSPAKDLHSNKPALSENISYHLFVRLLSVHEEVVTAIQRSKVEYMHKVTCSRRNHRLCILSKLVPSHHALLGMEARYSAIKPLDNNDLHQPNNCFMKKTAFGVKNAAKSKGGNNPSTSDENGVCAVATGVKFLVDLAVTLKSRSNFLREILRTLDRVGMCQCIPLSSIVTPFLCNISKWSDKTQNIALAIIGKMILHHYNEDEITPRQQHETFSSTSMHLLYLPNTWTPPSSLDTSSVKRGLVESKEPNASWRHSLPVNMKMSDASTVSSASKHQAVEGMMFKYNVDFPWLSLCLYQPLLHNNNGDVALKVALHLQSLSRHLCSSAKSALLTLVLVPVLCKYAGVTWDTSMETLCSEKQDYSEDVVFLILGTILQFLEESANCKALFVRHGGMKALNEIFVKTFFEREKKNPPSGCVVEVVLDMMRVMSVSTTSLSNHANVALFKASSSRYLAKQQSLDVSGGTLSETGGVRSFFRGISFSWGSDKRRTKDLQDRPSGDTASSRTMPASKPPSSCDSQLYSTVNVNENSVHFFELKKFVRMAMDITGATSYDRSKEMMRKAKNFVRGVSGAESTDSESSELRSSLKKRKRKMSETSGYRSTSPERSTPNDQMSVGSHSGTSTLSYVADSVDLPGEGELQQWKDIADLWNVLGLAVPQDDQLCSLFIELNGFEVALKLLNLISIGVNSYFEAEWDFTQTTVDQTTNGSLLQSTSLGSSFEISADKNSKFSSNEKLFEQRNTVPKIEITTPEKGLKKATSLDNLLSETFNISLFKSASPVTSTAQASVTSVVDNEVKRRVLDQKLNLFTSCLRVCLFCAKLRDQFELDASDVISMLKPALHGKISSVEFSRMLHSSLFRAAIKPVSKADGQFIRLKTVLHGLQRVINSGGSAHRMFARNNSINPLRNLTPVNQPDGRDQLLGSQLTRSEFALSTPPTPFTDGMGSQHATRDDDDEETLSDGLSSDGYDGDSETDSHLSTGMSSTNCLTPSKNDDSANECMDLCGTCLQFRTGPLVHPELVLLSIELLGNSSHPENVDSIEESEDLNDEGTDLNGDTTPPPDQTMTTRDEVSLSVIRSLAQVASYSKGNLNKMAKKNDVASACLSHFASYLQTDSESWKNHRKHLLALCMMLNKHAMTSKHIRLILSKFNTKHPPMMELLDYLLELVENQQFGPNWFMQFSWMKPDLEGAGSQSESDEEDEEVDLKQPEVPNSRSLTVWKVAPLHMPLAEGHVIMVESDTAVDSGQSSPYIHLLSVGSKQTMLQVWMESTTLIFRVCVDPNDSKPVGLLAQSECPNFLNTNEWQHLTLTYTESRMPDKAILGKVHLVLNCFVENDVILEFNVPQPAAKSGLSWRQSSPSLSVNLQKTNLFLGHGDNCMATSPSSPLATSSSTVAVGNIMVFNQPHPTCQSAFVLERLGPNATCLTECLSDARDQVEFMKDCRVRFGVDPLLSSTHDCTELHQSSRLVRLMPQALSNDAIPEEVFTGEVQPDIKGLQESLVMSFNTAEPSIFHVYIPNPSATPTRRRMLFRRTQTDTPSTGGDFDPLTQTGHRMNVVGPYKDVVRAFPCANLNRSLNHVGGVFVFLLLYPKTVELTSCMSDATSSEKERYQVQALKSLLKLRASSTERKKEFLSSGSACMLRKVMTKQEAVVGYLTLQVLFNDACSEDVIASSTYDNGETVYQINSENVAIIHDSEILQAFLLDWRVWHKATNASGDADFGVWMLLLQGFESLTRDDHPHQWFNSKMLLKAGIVQKMLEGVQEMVSGGISPLPGQEVTSLMVEVIRGIMGSPPDVAIMKILCNFLIAIHPPAGTFVCHAVSSFYFSLPCSGFMKSVSQDSIRGRGSPSTPGLLSSPFSNKSSQFSRTPSAPAMTFMKSPTSPPPLTKEGPCNDDTYESVSPVEIPDPPSGGPTGIVYKRQCSKRAELTPIKEDDHSSRPKSLDVSSAYVTSDQGEEEGHIGVTAEGEVSMTLERERFHSIGSKSTPLNGWENVPHAPETMESSDTEGVSLLVTETLNILFVAVMTMRDADVPLVFRESLNPRMLVVIAHHPSSSVQTAVVRLLAVYFSRCFPDEQAYFLKKKGFHLLANQLHQHVTSLSVVEACLYFLLGQPVAVDETLSLDGIGHGSMHISHDAFTNHAAITLLAVLEKSFWHGTDLCLNLLARLNELFEHVGPIADIMLDNGLTLALCNLLNAISNDPMNCLDHNQRQILYDGVEDFMGSIAIKSCVTSGSGHFQVFEDLMILLYTVENRAGKTHGNDSCQVKSIKIFTHNILLRVLEAMKLSSGGKTSVVKTRKLSLDVDPSSPRTSIGSSLSGSELSKMSEATITSSLQPAPPSPTLSDVASYGRNNVFVASHANGVNNSHRRAHSMGTCNDSFYVPSPALSRGRVHLDSVSHSSYNSANSDTKSTSSFRPRTNALRSRSFRGNQRRKINETETAHRLQRVIIISVDRIVFTEHSDEKLCASKTETFAPLFSPSPSEEPHRINNSFAQAISPQLSDSDRTFSQLTFDIIVEWLFSSIDSSKSTSWERILNHAHSVLAEQASRLVLHFLSPWQADLRDRAYPLHIMNHLKVDPLVNILFPPASSNGQKVAVYLHYLLYYYKQQLTKQEKHEGKKLSKIISRIGHRVSSQHRRAIHEASSEVELSVPGPLDEFQEKFDLERKKHRTEWNKFNVSQYQLLVTRTSRLAEHVSSHAMDMTQQVVLQQNNERKKMHGRMKEFVLKDLNIRKKWTQLLEQLAHERAVWYNPDEYPKSWQLNPTEGPFRERRRLQRCHIGIDKRFLLNNATVESTSQPRGIPVSMETTEEGNASPCSSFSVAHKRPLAFLFEDDSHCSDSVTIRTRLQTNERISMVQSCTNVTAACETTGEILIGESNMYFVADQAIVDPSLTQAIFGEREILSLSWHHRDVEEYHKRWWQLRDTAIEIFLINGKTYLIAFRNIFERDMIYDELSKLDLPNLLQTDDFQSLTKSWCSGRMTNFDYLTRLNKTAGRSFNDLMQYPVFPFVLSDYTSQILDLEATSSFRLLDKPISVQDPSREQHFRERYKFLEDDYKNCTEDERELKTPPFHYGSHYSNSGTVLHFLVRLPPFTQLFLEYQDSSFDIPDRTFHSMATTYRLSSYASTTDVKELIPEFFFLPEFLCNLEGFDFGLRQCGIRVHHVTLPLWCREDPRLFVLIHRQALESDYVTSYLHKWVDLVFGYKQMGQPALEAVNVFHPATYFGMDISSVDEPVKRKALETMVKTYGQTPKMLFSSPHPARCLDGENGGKGDTSTSTNQRSSVGGLGDMLPTSIIGSLRGSSDTRTYRRYRNSKVPRPIPSVKGLQWGDYVGSPSAAEPFIFLHKLMSGPIGGLVSLQTNDVCALAPKMSLLVVYTRDKKSSHSSKPVDISWSALVTFDKPDNIIRLKLKHNTPGINLARFSSDNHVACCVATPDCRSVIFGSRSGTIIAQRCNPLPEKGCDIELLPSTELYCHTAEITCLSVCGSFRIFVSGSKDGTAAIWDLDALSYVRSLTGHAGSVTSLAVSETSGDICTVCCSGTDSGSHIRLWTINGSLVAAQDCRHVVRCVAFSNAPEGVSVNVVAGGLENGTVRLWSSWDLTHVRDITSQSIHQPIVSIAYTHNSMVLYAATEGGLLVGWCRKDKEKEKQPLLITFLDSKTSPVT